MSISLVPQSTTPHRIHIIDKEHHSKLPNYLKTYTKEALKLEKHTPFAIGRYPLIQKDTLSYHIVVHVKNSKKFDHHVEDIVAELGALIKKSKVQFFLDLDDTIISHADKELLQELLAVNLYAFTKYKENKKLDYHLAIKNSHSDSKTFSLLVDALAITRGLINDPSNSVHPQTVEDEVRTIFAKQKSINITTITGQELEKKKLNGIYQVGK